VSMRLLFEARTVAGLLRQNGNRQPARPALRPRRAQEESR
jgi:hypothetical protein